MNLQQVLASALAALHRPGRRPHAGGKSGSEASTPRTNWRQRRLDRLECFCVSSSAPCCCDIGPILMAYESMETDLRLQATRRS